MSGKTYHLGIEIEGDSTQYIASAYGDLRVITFVARDAIKAMTAGGGQYSVALVEVDGILGDETRTIVDTTGDAEICGYVLTKRLRTEK